MRSILAVLRVLCAPLLLAAGCAAPPPAERLMAPYPAEQCASCAEWNAPQDPFRIFGNSWYVGTQGLAAILITSPEGHVLIDGGLPNSAPSILANIRTLGFDVADVRLILNSHAHYDHAGGIAALQRASGARVAASVPSAAVLEHGRPGPDDPQFEIHLDFPPVADVRVLADGEAVTVGPLSLTPHITAGHTPGGTTWTWRSCEADECLDLVFADSQTPVSADGFRFTGSAAVAGFERGSALLDRLACDILLTPHPGASSFWERRASAAGLVDRGACRRLAESSRQQLARRLAAEAAERVLVPGPRRAAPEDEVKAVFGRFVAAQNAHDLQAVGDLLLDAPQFLWITRGAPVWGREAALKRFEGLYQGTWHLAPDTAALRVMMMGDHAAQVYVPIEFTIGAAGQEAQSTRFLMNMTLVRTGAGWRVASILPVPAAEPREPGPYLIYLHGRIIEEGGRRPTDPAYGIYEYDAILDSMRQAGFTVLSDQRPPGIAIDSFVNRLVQQVDSLKRTGVPSRSITVVGFSRGGAIAILGSARLQDPGLSFVFMGACGSWAFERPELRVTGRILSLYETSDSLGVSCAPLFERRGPGSVVREVAVSLGLGHGTFYRPRREWLGPVLAWARGREP